MAKGIAHDIGPIHMHRHSGEHVVCIYPLNSQKYEIASSLYESRMPCPKDGFAGHFGLHVAGHEQAMWCLFGLAAD